MGVSPAEPAHLLSHPVYANPHGLRGGPYRLRTDVQPVPAEYGYASLTLERSSTYAPARPSRSGRSRVPRPFGGWGW